MANRSTLMFSADGVYSINTAASGVLAWNYCIPVLWFALFNQEDLRLHLHTESDKSWNMPYLITTANKARANLANRRDNLTKLLGRPKFNPYKLKIAPGLQGLQTLEEVLEQAKDYVILDPWEIFTLGVSDLDKLMTKSITLMDSGKLQPLMKFASTRSDCEEDYQAYCGYPWAT
jgi:hypothetical protein